MDTSERQLTIRSAGLTDIGCVRERNEDAFLADAENGIFIVADGIGGRQGGDVASRRVVEVLPEIINRRAGALPTPEASGDPSILAMLEESVSEASRAIRVEGEKKLECLGMGTTIAVALVTCRHAHIAYMGDSRVYLLRGGELRLLTEDHSIVGALLRHGEISSQEAVDHPARGRLTRFVGMEMEVGPGAMSLALEAGDRLLLCTDGLWGMVGDAKLCEILSARDDCEITCEDLIAAGKAAGGEDNLTAVVVDIHEIEYRDGLLVYYAFPPPRRLWKVMRAEHAKALVQRGEFFMRNVIAYRSEEPGPAKDEKEGILEYREGERPLTGHAGNHAYAWCSTTERDAQKLFENWPKHDVLVEIMDSEALFRRVRDVCIQKGLGLGDGIDWSEMWAGYAQYDRGKSRRSDPPCGHIWFQKGLDQEYQKEYRFVVVLNPLESQSGILAMGLGADVPKSIKLELDDCSDIIRIVAQRKEPAR